MTDQSRDTALDHVVVVVFENRSLDNVLGRLYGPGDGKTFEGVLGREMTAPYNAPAPGQLPTMDGFVTDYLSTLTAELGRQPTYEEYSQVMTGFSRGQLGFAFDRSGYRVPAILISPWVAEGEVSNAEHRHTSLIATLREQWGLGEPLTGRDAAARTFTYALALDIPRDPGTWPAADPRPVPSYVQDALALGQTLSTLGKAAFNGIRAYAEQNHVKIDGLPADPTAEVPPGQALPIIHNFLAIQFPLLHPSLPVVPPQQSKLGVSQP
jgi:hypothetical protein